MPSKPKVTVNPTRTFSPGTHYADLLKMNFCDVVLAFQQRIQKWYLDQALLGTVGHDGFLQTSMACIVLDILSQFYYDLPSANGEKFRDFLKFHFTEFNQSISPSLLSSSFSAKQSDWRDEEIRSLDQAFWHGFRCGIIHNGMILEYGRISGGFGTKVVQLRDREDGIGQEVVVNPKVLIESIDFVFNQYIRKLLNIGNHDLRKKFANKFERDFGIPINYSQDDREVAVCLSAISKMEKIENKNIFIIGRPDKEHKRKGLFEQKKSVDFLLKGNELIVLEHTFIESYPEQIFDNCLFTELILPLQELLKEKLPVPGRYDLTIDTGVTKSIKDANKVRKAIEIWILSKAPTLEIGSPQTTPKHFVTEEIPDVPFKITLCRWPALSPDFEGKLFFSRFAPEDIEEKRRERIRKALNDKCAKLAAAKKAFAPCRSVLLLEANDIALSNSAVIGEAFAKELSERTDELPDDVYLVEAEIKPGIVWLLKHGNKVFPETAYSGPCYPALL